jgi:hypothetical protein
MSAVAAASVVSLTLLAALQVSVTCERGRATHVFDISMSSEEPDQHEVRKLLRMEIQCEACWPSSC